MAVAASRKRDEQWVLLFCEDCGRPFHLTARQGRALRAEKRSARCKPCRRIERKLTVTEADYEFWLTRFTDDEICEIADASWGDPQTWDPGWRREFVFASPPQFPR